MLLLLLGFIFALAGCRAPDPPPVPSATTLPTTPPEARPDTPPEAPPDTTAPAAFNDLMAYAQVEALHRRPLGVIMQVLGTRLQGAPYLAGTLDEPAAEQLVIRFDGYDCVTFVETVLALAQTVSTEAYSYEAFTHNLLEQRYRGSRLDGYCSRLHYFSEWIADNEARGRVENITSSLGGERLDKTLNFMSANRDKYPRFAQDDSLFAGIVAMEADLAHLELTYIPQERIRSVYDQLQAGDIVALATSIEGLDVAHTGLVYSGPDGRRGLLHASTSEGVTIAPDLQAYVEGRSNLIGIVVARPRVVVQ